MPKPTIDAWFRQLQGNRLEVFFRVVGLSGQPDRKIRASGPAAEMNELADWFESKTGMTVHAPWRTLTRKPMPGQLGMDLELTMGELSSDATIPDYG